MNNYHIDILSKYYSLSLTSPHLYLTSSITLTVATIYDLIGLACIYHQPGAQSVELNSTQINRLISIAASVALFTRKYFICLSSPGTMIN